MPILPFLSILCVRQKPYLEDCAVHHVLKMIALSSVQSFAQILIHNAILFINASTILGRPYLAMIAVVFRLAKILLHAFITQ